MFVFWNHVLTVFEKKYICMDNLVQNNRMVISVQVPMK